MGNNGVFPFYNRFYCGVFDTFKVYTTYIYCQKFAEEQKIKKGTLNCPKSRKKDLKRHKISRDHFLEYFAEILRFEFKTRKSKKTILRNYKKFF